MVQDGGDAVVHKGDDVLAHKEGGVVVGGVVDHRRGGS